MNISSKVSDFVIISVFYKFVYEIRLVVLKLESDGPEDFKKKLKRQRIIWVLIYLTLSINLVLSIYPLVKPEDELTIAYNFALIT